MVVFDRFIIIVDKSSLGIFYDSVADCCMIAGEVTFDVWLNKKAFTDSLAPAPPLYVCAVWLGH